MDFGGNCNGAGFMRHYSAVMLGKLFTRKGVSIERLKGLCEIADAGGIMAAAAGEPSKQSLLSRQIKELEGAFGFDLLDRDTVPHGLSERGGELEKMARNFLENLDNFAAVAVGHLPQVTIGAGESLIQWFLIPAFSRVDATEFAVRFRNLTGRGIVEAIRGGRVDVGLVSSAYLGKELSGTEVATYGAVLVGCARQFQKRKSLRWEEYCSLESVLLEGRGKLRREVERIGRKRKSEPRVVLECTSYAQVLEACRKEGRVGIVPEIARSAAKDLGLGVWAQSDLNGYKVKLTLVTKNGAEANPAVMKVLKILGSRAA